MSRQLLPRRSERLAEFLAPSRQEWPKLRALVAKLSDAELAQAEAIERLGKRRANVMKVLRAERYARQGQPEKMSRLKVEAR